MSDIFGKLETIGFVFVLAHQHSGEKTVCLIASRLSRPDFIEAAGREVIIGRVDEKNKNRVNHVGVIRQNAGVTNVTLYIADRRLTETLREFGVEVIQESYKACSYWEAGD